jgi:hypothetical protein
MNIGEKRENVKTFMEDVDISPLVFDGYDSPRKKLNSTDVNAMVLRCLRLTIAYKSASVKMPLVEQCKENASRSVLDIWRHIIYYYPDITIFQVMNSLFDLVASSVVTTLYCNQIKRRVFFFSAYPNYIRNRLSVDEFDLAIDDWRDI